MTTEALDRMKVDLCTQIEDMIALLSNAENSIKQGNFEDSADILKTVLEKANVAEVAARNSRAEAVQTPWSEFQRPILEVLVREGGSARIWQVFEYLEENLPLTEGDKDKHVADTRETEWQHECRVAANAMANEPLNYLEPVTTPGIWTIAESGRRHLEELRRADGLALQ